MFRIPVVSYSIFVVLWFCLYLIWPDRWWPTILLNKLAFFFLVLALPMFLVSLATKSIRIVALSFLPVAIFLYFYLPFFLLHPDVKSGEPSLRIMTYNIWNQNKDIDSLIENIKTSNPDILVVQELMDDVQVQFVKKLKQEYPYYRVSPKVYGGTTALFSKYELINVREINFNVDRPAVLADISIGGKAARVIGAHLYPSFYAYNNRPIGEMPSAIKQYIEVQHVQIRMLLTVIRKSGDIPVILACDCNVQRTSSSRTLLEEELIDSLETLGWQRGLLPVGSSFERDIDHIDYVWYRGDITPTGLYRMNDAGGSDHAPVYADFIL